MHHHSWLHTLLYTLDPSSALQGLQAFPTVKQFGSSLAVLPCKCHEQSTQGNYFQIRTVNLEQSSSLARPGILTVGSLRIHLLPELAGHFAAVELMKMIDSTRQACALQWLPLKPLGLMQDPLALRYSTTSLFLHPYLM